MLSMNAMSSSSGSEGRVRSEGMSQTVWDARPMSEHEDSRGVDFNTFQLAISEQRVVQVRYVCYVWQIVFCMGTLATEVPMASLS